MRGTPLIRPSGTFSPLTAGRRVSWHVFPEGFFSADACREGFFSPRIYRQSPSPRLRGEGGAQRRVRGRARVRGVA
jgi:hypothetical protein